MNFKTSITRGKAVLTPDGLRCRALRSDSDPRPCNKLIAKRNTSGLVAGSFQCERCRQQIEVEVAPRDAQ